jgi:hypothetical protein
MSNAKPANYICRCEFTCTNDYEDIPYMQNLPLETPNEGPEKCFIYSNDSCKQQGLKLKEQKCAFIKNYKDFTESVGQRG